MSKEEEVEEHLEQLRIVAAVKIGKSKARSFSSSFNDQLYRFFFSLSAPFTQT